MDHSYLRYIRTLRQITAGVWTLEIHIRSISHDQLLKTAKGTSAFSNLIWNFVTDYSAWSLEQEPEIKLAQICNVPLYRNGKDNRLKM